VKPAPAVSAAPASAQPPPKPKESATTATTTSEKEKDSAGTVESNDAWVAAQHILKAINFGSLQDNSNNDMSKSASVNPNPSRVDPGSTAHLLPIMASIGVDIQAARADVGSGRTALTDEERASLQAQLALLAAQLSELAADEELREEEEDGNAVDADPSAPAEEVTLSLPPASNPQASEAAAATSIQSPILAAALLMDVNHFPDHSKSQEPLASDSSNEPRHVSSPILALPGELQYPSEPVDTIPDDTVAPATSTAPVAVEQSPVVAAEDSDEDEDMEMVDVDNYVHVERIQT
jgi:hypothetical protein